MRLLVMVDNVSHVNSHKEILNKSGIIEGSWDYAVYKDTVYFIMLNIGDNSETDVLQLYNYITLIFCWQFDSLFISRL